MFKIKLRLFIKKQIANFLSVNTESQKKTMCCCFYFKKKRNETICLNVFLVTDY